MVGWLVQCLVGLGEWRLLLEDGLVYSDGVGLPAEGGGEWATSTRLHSLPPLYAPPVRIFMKKTYNYVYCTYDHNGFRSVVITPIPVVRK